MTRDISPTALFALLLLTSFSFKYQTDNSLFFANIALVGAALVLYLIVQLCREIWKSADNTFSLRELFQKKSISKYEILIPFILILTLLGIFSFSQQGGTGGIENLSWELSWGRNFFSFGVLILSLVSIFLHRLLILLNGEKQANSSKESA